MEVYHAIKEVLGLDLEPKDLTFIQISLRGIIVFIASLTMVRLGNKRFLARMSAFDAILGFILASMLARAVNGSASFFPTLGGGFVLVWLHSLLASAAYRSHWFGRLVKGRPDVLVHNGKSNPEKMRSNKISEHDLLEEARLNGQVLEVSDIRQATIERNGEVSVVPAD
jgi:uncharacterized membrane protein YcaP (DUF421 family)